MTRHLLDSLALGLATLLCLAAWTLTGSSSVTAQPASNTVQISLPAAVNFFVTNVGAATIGSPGPSPVLFSNLDVRRNRGLRVSVRAVSNFSPPSGAAIPASMLSWTVSSAVNGFGANGTLGTGGFRVVYESFANVQSGSFDVTWTLGAPGPLVRAGVHTLTMRWRLESFKP